MPLNRFITFVKPYVNLLAAALSAWLIAKANVLAIPGLGEHGDDLTAGIAAAITFGLTTLVTQLGDLSWMKGHHLELVGQSERDAAVLSSAAEPPGTTLLSEPITGQLGTFDIAGPNGTEPGEEDISDWWDDDITGEGADDDLEDLPISPRPAQERPEEPSS